MTSKFICVTFALLESPWLCVFLKVILKQPKIFASKVGRYDRFSVAISLLVRNACLHLLQPQRTCNRNTQARMSPWPVARALRAPSR